MKTVDMEEEMEKVAIETATFALNEFTVEKEMANHIKKEFDKKYRWVTSPVLRGDSAASKGRRKNLNNPHFSLCAAANADVVCVHRPCAARRGT